MLHSACNTITSIVLLCNIWQPLCTYDVNFFEYITLSLCLNSGEHLLHHVHSSSSFQAQLPVMSKSVIQRSPSTNALKCGNATRLFCGSLLSLLIICCCHFLCRFFFYHGILIIPMLKNEWPAFLFLSFILNFEF